MKSVLEGVLIGVALLAGGAVAQSGAEISLRAAIERETVKGDLKGAIEQYNKILAQKSTPRPVAARALFQLGQCEEKLGQAEARKAYERLVQEYGDQPELVAQARAKLAGMSGGAAGESGVKAVQVWEGAPGVNTNGVSHDGRYVAYVLSGTKVAVHDLQSGTDRKVAGEDSGLNVLLPTQFFWAPEGKALYLSGAGCRALDIATGRVSELLDKNVQCGSGAVGSPDNRAIYYYTRATQGQVSAANPRRIIRHDTKTEQETEVYRNEDSGISNLSLSPDGRYLALVANPMTYWAIPVAGGEPVKIPVPNAAGGWMQGPIAWTPDSRAVVFARRDQQSRQTEIWVQPISGGKARPTGLAAKGISGVSNILPDGRIAYTASESSYAVWAIRSLFTESRNK